MTNIRNLTLRPDRYCDGKRHLLRPCPVQRRTSFVIYWANLVLLGLAVYVTWAYAERAKFVRDDAPSELSNAFRRRVIIAQSLYALGAVVGLLDITLGMP